MTAAERAYTEQELDRLATPLSIHLERAARDRDPTPVPWIVEQLDGEVSNMFEAYVSWLGVLQTFIIERAGQDAHDQALTFAGEAGARPFVHAFAGLSARDRAIRVAWRLRMTGSTFEVTEDEERIRFRADPWGGVRWWRRPQAWGDAQQRLRVGNRYHYKSYGYYDEPIGFAMLEGARPLTQGRDRLPSYLATEIQLLELLAIEVLGAPIAVITLPDDADGPAYLDVYKDPADVPAEAYARVGAVKPGGGLPAEPRGRRFTGDALERLATPLSIQVEAAGAAGDFERLAAIGADLDAELICVKDPQGIVIASLLSWIAWHLGEDAVEEVLERTAEVVMAPYVGAVSAVSPTEAIPMWAMVWRSHGSTFSIEEDDEKFIFRGRPLGTCHRMWSHAYQQEIERISDSRVRYPTFGAYDPPTGLHRMREARPITRGRVGYPIYSCHCHMLHTIYPIDQIGRPLWVEEHPLDDPDGDTVHIHWKDPDGWPARFYEEVGRVKPARQPAGVTG
jgi:hypothetical protein